MARGKTYRAIAERIERVRMIEEKIHEMILDGSIFIAWREFADPSLDPNAPTTVHGVLFVRSTDGGRTYA